ncbi:Immune inhibitor A precursor [Stieleria maiorica]|uniref:Immune inhibitor A n=1 Tax=Stieleria maiorica TaxID=2795974 RepID=A0A5B9ME97_9BACT|nr:M6 family metalloprotease domain-containing protein [Stieleria maiorica]QEF98300.1 Immune inhibitor A precursor [Stieleria maiorica]
MWLCRIGCTFLVFWIATDQRAIGNLASPFPVEVTQPSGETIQLYIRGNEKLNWYEYVPEARNIQRGVAMSPADATLAATPGYTVIKDADGRYVYAQLDADSNWVPTDVAVGAEVPQNLQRRLIPPPENVQRMIRARLPEQNIPSRAAAPLGTVKNLVVLLRFADHTGRTLPSKADYEQLFNAQSPVPNLAPTGSVKMFYQENSYAKMNLESTVVDWVTLPKKEAYYANGQSGLTSRIWEALRDGLDLVRASGSVDFADFDNEINQNGGKGDGWIDAITFVHSGYAAEFGGVAGGADMDDRIWSHRWTMTPWTDPASGVKVSNYNINPGIWGTSGTAIGRIGVICHELGHFFGLPDLYDYSGKGEGCGSWCLMANSWGFDGTQFRPPHMSAWCKLFLSWNSAQLLSTPGTYEVEATSLPGANIYRINYPSGPLSEYLLIENRQAVGRYDGGIPAGTGGQGGLAIWHIDDSVPENDQPGYPGSDGFPADHYKVGLIQADGLWELEKGLNRGNANDVFRQGHNDSLTATTDPNSNSFTGVQLPPIKNISASSSKMSFQYGDAPIIVDDTVLAGVVNVEVPTSHSVNFSPDGKAATILLDRLVSYAYGDAAEVKHATFVLPLKDASENATVAIQVRGYYSTDDGSVGRVILSANGSASIIDPKASAAPQASRAMEPDAKGAKQANHRATAERIRRGNNPKPSNVTGDDFFYESSTSLVVDEKLPITIVLQTERLTSDSVGAYLVIDSIDVEIKP